MIYSYFSQYASIPVTATCISFTHHSIHHVSSTIDRGALRSVAVTEAVAPHHHVVNGVVVLLLDLNARIQQIVPQRMQLSELHSQVSNLQHIYKTDHVRKGGIRFVSAQCTHYL